MLKTPTLVRLVCCLGLLVATLGCNEKAVETPKVQARLINKSLTHESNIFVNTVSDFQYLDGHFVLSEYDKGRLLILNDKFELDTIVGAFGHGPGEYRYVGATGSWQGQVYAHDIQHAKLRLYDEHFDSFTDITLPNAEDVNNFVLLDSSVYYGSTDGLGAPIVAYSLKTDEVTRFGEFVQNPLNDSQKYNRSQGYIFNYDGFFIYFLVTEPKAFLYNKRFEKLYELDLSKLNLFQNSIARAEWTYKNKGNTYLKQFEDAFQVGDIFYLAAYQDFKKPEDSNSYDRSLNTVLKIKLDDENQVLELASVIDLSIGGGWYSDLYIDETQGFFCFDAVNNEIHEFKVD